jgi:1-acyl-sn-glycerol-3-phosphate acyltransferase
MGVAACAVTSPVFTWRTRAGGAAMGAPHVADSGRRAACDGGCAKGGPLLLVSNHVSWLDILVINAVRPARFVSKADVRHWPLVGELITAAGTLYIEREKRRDAMRVVHRMADSLREGDVVAVFPEGTTGSGLDVLPFHANCCKRPFQPTHRSSRWRWSTSTRLPGIRARHPCMWVTRPFWPRSGEP